MTTRLSRNLFNQPVGHLWRAALLGGIGLTVILAVVNLGASWPGFGPASVPTLTLPDFVRWGLVPALIGLFALGIAAVAVYLNPQVRSVKLYALFTLATACYLLSQPDFIAGPLAVPNFMVMGLGNTLMPPLLLHFLLYFPHKHKVIRTWPFLLPLIYLPVLPILSNVPALLENPAQMRLVGSLLNAYMMTYTLVGLGLVLHAMRVGNSRTRVRALVLFVGLILPLSLLGVYAGMGLSPLEIYSGSFYLASARYLWWGVSISIGFAILRFNTSGPLWNTRRRLLYTGIIGGILAICLLLLGLASPSPLGSERLGAAEVRLMLGAIIVFYGGKFGWRTASRWWAERHLRYSLDDFKVNVRILSQELLRVRTRRELEALVSWNLATDFNLQSAEISSRNIASSPYALSLPLKLYNISLGTLFLGPKTNGDVFSEAEQAVFAEAQQQIALALLSIELDEAIQVMAELTRLKGKFLANVTHELRTPLNGIINYIGFVLDEADTLNEEQILYLDQALHGAEKLLDLINNILDMSKIEAGQMRLLKRPVDITEIVSELVPVVDSLVGPKPITLITEVSPVLPMLTADRIRLRQIMFNLLSNAARFTDAGQIHLLIYPENGSVIIKVSDTGQGIEESIMPVIFDQFITKELIDTGQASGSGLGLPITKSLVELHDGYIEVISRVNEGSIFTVSIPVQNGNGSASVPANGSLTTELEREFSSAVSSSQAYY